MLSGGDESKIISGGVNESGKRTPGTAEAARDRASGRAWSGRYRRANDSPGVDKVGVADVEDGPGPGQQGGKDASLVGAAVWAAPPHDPMVTEHE